MSDRGASPGPSAAGFGGILKGMLLLGRGRAEGITYFGGTRDAVLSALAPRLALWLVLGADHWLCPAGHKRGEGAVRAVSDPAARRGDL
ncbi:hypothetical protein RAA17_07795 [Komagataeibacter rhaeticus]|nr:hypothetical protein [Komagataeibacter rhaeticus]